MSSDQVILPVQMPKVLPYQHQAAALSILSARDVDFMPWFCNQFTQLRVIEDPASQPWLDFYSYMYDEFPICPWLKTEHLSHETVLRCGDGIEQFLMDSLRMERYVYIVVECRYVSLYPAFGKYDSPHPLFVYGFDQAQRIFYVADFFKGQFEFGTVSFDEMRMSILHYKKRDNNFEGAKLIAFNPGGAAYRFDFEQFRELLKDYVLNRDTRLRYRFLLQVNAEEQLGIDPAYARLRRDIQHSVQNSGSELHVTSFHVLYEHKKTLAATLRYLREQGHITGEYDMGQLERQGRLLRNLIVKFGLSRSAAVAQRAIEQLDAMWEGEKRLLLRCIQEWDHAGVTA
ncbi:hypothetical protein PaecuDRAFT_1569 [Paenibacillus curdlanolyticus YK9]|uniref:Uncharacterized protein n=2 Tax=Paenibacillus curdlanolyticus TaxID=59840 RepID=E0I7E5_9BACL|nr:hypothetical protein PaecuDRAFT_1569 [Paenibacillus curdlanolyticus YK9]